MLLAAENNKLIDNAGIHEEVDTFTFAVRLIQTYVYPFRLYTLNLLYW